MKYLAFLLIVVGAVSCTPTTQLAGTRVAEDLEPKKYGKIAVLAFMLTMDARATLEEAIAGKLQEKGYNGKVSFDIFPLATNKQVLADMDMSDDAIKARVREKIAKNQIDAVITVNLLDTKQEERYVPGSNFVVTTGFYGYPGYMGSFYDYYAYTYGSVYSNPGYYVNTKTYFLETNLYDISGEKLVWTAQSTTKDPKSIEKEAAVYAELVVKDMEEKQVILK